MFLFNFNDPVKKERYLASLDDEDSLSISISATSTTSERLETETISVEARPYAKAEGEEAWSLFFQHCTFDDIAKRLNQEQVISEWAHAPEGSKAPIDTFLEHFDITASGNVKTLFSLISAAPAFLEHDHVRVRVIDCLEELKNGTSATKQVINEAVKNSLCRQKEDYPKSLREAAFLLDKLKNYLRPIAKRNFPKWPSKAQKVTGELHTEFTLWADINCRQLRKLTLSEFIAFVESAAPSARSSRFSRTIIGDIINIGERRVRTVIEENSNL